MSESIALQVATAFFQFWFPFSVFLFAVWMTKRVIFD